MRFSYSATELSAFVLIILASPMAHGESEIREVRTLSAVERAMLPDTAKVSVRGHIVAMSTLRAFHADRLRMAAGAAEYGRSFARNLRLEEGPSSVTNRSRRLPRPRANSGTTVEAGSASVQQMPSALNPTSVSNPILMPDSLLSPYAKDYQDFCKAARATACIYLPVMGAWQSTLNKEFKPKTQTLLDPLITDATVCASQNGTITADGCTYTYPIRQVTNFLPSLSPTFASAKNCPIDPAAKQGGYTEVWETIVDPHGAAAAAFIINSTWPAWLYTGSYLYSPTVKPAACVVQVSGAP